MIVTTQITCFDPEALVTSSHKAVPITIKEHLMQFIRIAGAALLTGVGLGSLAASSVLWKQADIELGGVLRGLLAQRA